MAILGKILGGTFGFLVAGPIGCVMGIGVGHIFDSGLSINLQRVHEDISVAQNVFFSTTFEMMGYIAKADGRISEREIQMARTVMAQLQLSQEQRLRAIQYFNLGKSDQFNWDATMENFIKNCGRHPQLIHLFVEIQIQSAYAEGQKNAYKHNALLRLCQKLRIPQIILDQMESQYDAEQSFRQHRYTEYRSHQQNRYQPPPRQVYADEVADAYRLLAVEKSATDAEVKKAYRQLMSQHHPDKLLSKGLPEAMIKVATEKTQSIQRAYEIVCKARGMK